MALTKDLIRGVKKLIDRGSESDVDLSDSECWVYYALEKI
jgi:hypothetical protein